MLYDPVGPFRDGAIVELRDVHFIPVTVELEDEETAVDDIQYLIDLVNQIAANVDRDLFFEFKENWEWPPNSEIDPLPEPFFSERKLGPFSRYFVFDVRKGSITLTGVLGLVVAWVIKDILADTLKEAWKDTKVQKRVKRKIAKLIDSAADKLTVAGAKAAKRHLIVKEAKNTGNGITLKVTGRNSQRRI